MERTPSDFLSREKARLHDAADALVTDADLEAAREEIVETVMLFGQYPQPRPWRSVGVPRRVEFSLEEFLFDTAGVTRIDPREVESMFVLSLIDRSRCGRFEDARDRHEKEVTEMLTAHFNNQHRLVVEKAQEIADERDDMAREAAEEARRGL